jgi:DNA-binding NarL/FixJ family response regulator
MPTAKTEVLTKLEIDASTGEEIIKPLTQTELEQREIDAQNFAIQQAEQEAKATARASALAKLKTLGLTEQEIAAL